MSISDNCSNISRSLTHNLRLAANDEERLEFLYSALKSVGELVIPPLNNLYRQGGEDSPDLARVRSAVLDLATFICGNLVRKCSRHSRGVSCLQEMVDGCAEPQLKNKLVFYVNQLKKRWNVIEPGGLSHNPRAKRIRPEMDSGRDWLSTPALVGGVATLCIALYFLVGGNTSEPISSPRTGSVQAQSPPKEAVSLQEKSLPEVTVPAGAIYSYTDRQGVVHMVDNLDRVPQEYRQVMTVVGNVVAPSDSTPVIIKGNQVLVPVAITFQGRRVESYLLLDTGATITAINEQLAEQLGVGAEHKKVAESKVADGRSVGSYRFTADAVAVGSRTTPGLKASILPGSGGKGYEGLLGMNYLKQFRYHVNFDRRLIEWDTK